MPDRWDVVATLVDPSRRALFDYVRRQDHPVGREEAAAATGVSRGLAAFHLDKLVEAGLLEARYEAPAGPRGRGRTPKVYRPLGEVAITIPARRDDLIADVLAAAYLSHRPPDDVAFDQGTAHSVADLAALGFEPDITDDLIRLRNCPFHSLAARHGSLICGIALSFVTGMAGSSPGYAAIPDSSPGGCCVALRRTPPPSSPPAGG
ncbi:helix-turn-helix domain-containing protein [Actinoplanes sp. NPDC051411]|uniref:helix-turn-helix transcriptional regulator n=1 Tax=Actinoplanes sp. NPDC051411 TaxID=3155522 RepID=UPI0034232AA3